MVFNPPLNKLVQLYQCLSYILQFTVKIYSVHSTEYIIQLRDIASLRIYLSLKTMQLKLHLTLYKNVGLEKQHIKC